MRKPVYHVFVTQESQPDAQGEKKRTGQKLAWPSRITASPA
ncbi:hypothetical protein [Enterobacter oligotrophicus]|nr:hypothetical protein [Enterobacter oligotrophicus]